MKTLIWVCLVLYTIFPVSGSDDEGSPNGSGYTNPSFGAYSSNNLRDSFHVGAPPKVGSFSQVRRTETPQDLAIKELLAKPNIQKVLSNSFAVKLLSNPEIVGLLLQPNVVTLLLDENARQALLKAAQEKEAAEVAQSMFWEME